VCVARAGQGTKLIINGDIHQIIEDAKGVYVNEYTNGLVHIINTLKGQQGFGCIELNGKSKRSEIAELSSLL
jgi:predicted ribonuclease YlaK